MESSPDLNCAPATLNEAQQSAVTHGAGPVLVIAGAGSGKTRTLVHRVAHLLDQGVAPESILLLTFTRRAAQEMLLRASQLTKRSCHQITGGTFHATANILLHRYGHYLGYDHGFTIIDRADSEGIINLLKSSLNRAGTSKAFPNKRTIINILSGAVNRNLSIEGLVTLHFPHLIEFLEDIAKLGSHYSQFKRDHAVMDYDDLLVNWHRLLSEAPAACAEITARFRHILVDEYQDTNHIQAAIVRLLAADHHNVMAVGDDAQSIYNFRGADFYNIIRFPEQFPATRIIKLEENYRSTQAILDLTNAVIAAAREKFTKTLYTKLEGGGKPVLFAARNEGGEARFVVETIKQVLAKGIEPREIAVLFRSGFHSYKLEMELASHSLDFEKRGGLKLTESAHIKDVLSFFRILVNPGDNLSWNRILLQIDKVGPKTAEKIWATLKQSADPFAALAEFKPAAAWQQGFAALVTLLQRLSRESLTPSAQGELIMTYYQPIFERIYHDDYPRRRKELDQLQALIGEYKDLQKLVDDTVLDPPESAMTHDATRDGGQLVLSTIHSAKGLEWEVVFIIGLAEDRFPHPQVFPTSEQWEEERRLLYVAATRAKKQLYLTYPQELVTVERKTLRTSMSPFVREIPPSTYQVAVASAFPAASRVTLGQGLAANGPGETGKKAFAPGMRVHHAYFGSGKITSLPGPRQVQVVFDVEGLKNLHLDYAKLEIIE